MWDMRGGYNRRYLCSHLESVEKHSIDIILAMDDVISMGYRESVTVQEVSNQLSM
jgi:hypothetical protein